MQLLHVQDVADLLSLRIKQVRELSRKGIIPTVRVGRLLRFDPDALHQWIAEGGRGHEDRRSKPKISEDQSSAIEFSQSRTDNQVVL